MASGAVSFVLNLVNNISGPASQALRSVTSLRGGLMALTSLPGLIVGGAAAAGIKSIIDAAGYKQQQLIAFGTALHSTSEAAKVYQRAVTFAAATPFETKETVDATRNLLAFGFTAEQTFAVLKRAGNIAAGTSKPLSQVVMAFQALKSGDFGQAFGAGQGFSQLGISRPMLEAEGLKFDKSGSYVGSVTAALTAVRKIADRNFGGLMDVQSRSITGLASTLASRPFELFSSLMPNSGTGGPLSSMQKLMANLSDMTNFEAGPGAKIKDRFQKSMGGLFSAVFDPLAAATSGDKGIQFVNRLLDKLDELAGWWRTYGPAITANAKGFLDGLMAAGQVMWTIISPVITFVQWLGRLNGGGNGSIGQTIGLVLGLTIGLRALNSVTLGLGPALGRAFMGSNFMLGILTHPAGILAGLRAAFSGMFGAVVTGARVMWTALTGPIGLVIAGIALIGAGLTYLYFHYKPFRTLVDGTWDRVKVGYKRAGEYLSYGWNAFSTAINRADASTNKWFSGVYDWFGKANQATETWSSHLSDSVTGWFSGTADKIVGFFNSIPSRLAGLGASLYNAILPQGVRDALASVGIKVSAPTAPSPTGPLPAMPGDLVGSTKLGAAALGVNPNDLMAIMNFESRLNPAAVNPLSHATGLIQFTDAAAKDLGMKKEQFGGMTAAQQMPFIVKYLQMHGVKPGMGLEQLYMSVLSGSANNSGALYRRGSKEYTQNAGLDTDHDGVITSSEAVALVRQRAAAAGIIITNNITLGKKPTAQDLKAVEQAAHAGSNRAFNDYMGALGNENGLGGHL